MIRFNPLTTTQAREAKAGDTYAYNTDRRVIDILFGQLSTRFANRQGGYTQIVKSKRRIGDNAQTCIIQYLPE